MDEGSLWAVLALCASPFLAFGLVELWMARRRKREAAVARRRKDIPSRR